MKLSPLKVGDLIKVLSIYVVITDDIRMYHNIDTRQLLFMDIICFKIFGVFDRLMFRLNGISPEEVLQDEYSSVASYFPKEDLPLLINEPNKTKWFDKILKGDIQNVGTPIYPILLNCIKNKSIMESEND